MCFSLCMRQYIGLEHKTPITISVASLLAKHLGHFKGEILRIIVIKWALLGKQILPVKMFAYL